MISMDMTQVAQTIEAILFAMGDAVEISDIASSLEIDAEQVREGAKLLQEKYTKNISGIRLIERGLIDELGRAETPGRPILYGTTMEFLRTFGIKTLEDLPPLPDKVAGEEEASSDNKEEAN